jgi:PiT family inorganic phosphate transporter
VDPSLLIVVVIAALVFAWTNGFHDASNAVATALATGALTPRVALAIAAVLNVVGGLFGVSVAQTLRSSLLDVPIAHPGLGLVLAALLAAVVWNLGTWWLGMPSSSSHALVGGLAGAGLVAGAGVDWAVMVGKVLLPMLLSPVLGFVLGWLLVAALLRITKDVAHGPMLRRFRLAQTVSAAAVAVGHGLQDAQKTAAVVVLALVASGREDAGGPVPVWVRLAASFAVGLGTWFGGWRIIRTLGRRLVTIDPMRGFAAELVTAGALYAAAGVFAAPISSTHVIVSAIMGSGATQGLHAIRWQWVRWIALVFVTTPLATAAIAAGLYAIAP